jgi:acetolactate synthase-1/2/3 large subunit
MTTMHDMTGGQAIVQSLLQLGVDTVFGLPGAQTYALFDAMYENRQHLRYIGSRHEQGAAYMALGYSRSTGRAGVFSVVPGPGVLNTGAALATAYATNAPVLCLTGQVPSAGIGSGRGYLHELPDQLATLRSLTKWAGRIDHPSEVPAKVALAYRHMLTGRPRPVALETPWDVLDSQAAVDAALDLQLPNPPEPEPQQLDAAVQLIRQAAAPMVMVGSGAMEAGAEVLRLAQLVQAPVVSFRSGRGVVANDSPYGLTCAEGYRLWQDTDLLIGIGSRLELQYMRWMKIPPGLKVIRIDIDPEEMQRLAPDVALIGDAAAVTAILMQNLEGIVKNKPSREKQFNNIKQAVAREIRSVQPQMDYLDVIREVLPRDGIFVDEISQAGMTAWFGFPVYAPRTFITCGYAGTLGYGFNTALGVKVGNPEKAVVSVNGDGGFLFGVQELATAQQYHIALVTIVFNNGGWGNVRRDQLTRMHGHLFGVDLHNPDFVRLAQSFGINAWRTDTPAGLRTCLGQALEADTPALIEVTVARDSEEPPWDFLMPGNY